MQSALLDSNWSHAGKQRTYGSKPGGQSSRKLGGLLSSTFGRNANSQTDWMKQNHRQHLVKANTHLNFGKPGAMVGKRGSI